VPAGYCALVAVVGYCTAFAAFILLTCDVPFAVFGQDAVTQLDRRFPGGIGLAILIAGLLLVPYVAARMVYDTLRKAYRRAYRRLHNCCWTCDYDLTGNVSGTCPECGARLTVNEPQRRPQ